MSRQGKASIQDLITLAQQKLTNNLYVSENWCLLQMSLNDIFISILQCLVEKRGHEISTMLLRQTE